MKKFIAVLLTAMLIFTLGTALVSAEDISAEVYVTVADANGSLALSAEKVTVTDIDSDGALTINDALYAAHEKFYDGGAAAGYATATTQYGLSLTKLWGTENGYSYGYMVNNISAWSMTDPVAEGDHVSAFVYTDTKFFSDKYSYFESFVGSAQAGELSLTLMKNDYDADWNPVTLPVEGAIITVDGVDTASVTDENGNATVTIDANGSHVISARSTSETIVPPVYVVEISGGIDPTTAPTTAPTEASTQSATVSPTQAATQTATTATTSSSTNSNAVQTGAEQNAIFAVAIVAVLALFVIVTLRKKYEN